VQLLFFPTRGGKTEAYLGLTAYTFAMRRLQGVLGSGGDARDGTTGVAVLMRYTLRLLTAQQFQRAAALVCACEWLRRERIAAGDGRWGDTPFRIGLWVGSKVTPNSFDEAKRQVEDSRGQDDVLGGPLQLACCPWCGARLSAGGDVRTDDRRRRVLLFCSDPEGDCAYSPRHSPEEGLPVVTVDEEIYRLTPALVIGTVDKFAQLPWRAATSTLFGLVEERCPRHGWKSPDFESFCKGNHQRTQHLPATQPEPAIRLRPPDLIIQDELHLIVDLPSMSVVVRSIDSWGQERAEAIDEPRLLEQVRRTLGPQVRTLRTPPWDPKDSEDPWTRTGIPVSPFPRWLRCPRCHRLGPLDPPGQFELVHRSGRRPDLAKWVHAQCSQQTQVSERRRRACLPARFVVACEAGHLDDFPYVDFVHHGRTEPCLGPKLRMRDNASTLGPRVTVRCDECGASRNIAEAAGRDGWEKLPVCRGRHPHLQRFETCGRQLRGQSLPGPRADIGGTRRRGPTASRATGTAGNHRRSSALCFCFAARARFRRRAGYPATRVSARGPARSAICCPPWDAARPATGGSAWITP
jgi:hypothetical protein